MNTLFDALFAPLADRETPFLHLPDGGHISGRAFYAMLSQQAHALRAAGLTAGDRIAVQVGKSPQALAVYGAAVALGAILIFGVAYLLAQGLADAAPRALTRRTVLMSVVATVAYLALQRGSEWLTAGTLPAAPAAGPREWALILLALVSFGAVAMVQSTLPLWSHHPAAQGLRVHLSNGFYINAIEDRLLRGWSRKMTDTGVKS